MNEQQMQKLTQPFLIKPDGDIAGPYVEQLASQIDSQLEQGRVELLIDCSNVGFIDGKGLELLLTVAEKCQQRFGKLRLANVTENCRLIFHITRLEKLSELIESSQKAATTGAT